MSAWLLLFLLCFSAVAAEPPLVRAGSELDFRPYCFTDASGQPTGFGVDLLRAVGVEMGLRLQVTPAPWGNQWNKLVAGELDVLPIVARTPGREPFVDFSLPHTETFDAFFVRTGRPPIKDLASAAGKEIVVLREDAAHHQLVERKFPGTIIAVDSPLDGLRLIAAGKHDAFLCSNLIGVLEREEAGIKGVVSGPPIPDYHREFSFAVPKGRLELLEKLNQGLRIVKATGEYDRIYRKWLGVEPPPEPWWQTVFWRAIGMLGVLALIGIAWGVARKALALEHRRAKESLSPSHAMPAAFWRYALAVVTVALCYAVRIGLEAWVGGPLPIFLLLYPGVMIAALLGGLGPGLLATVLAAVVNASILSSGGQFTIGTPAGRAALALFFVASLFLTAVAELYRRTRTQAAELDRAEALRRSEERLELTLQASEVGTFEVDLRSGEGRWNAVEYALLGLRPGDAPAGPETFFRFVHPEDIAELKAQWEQATRTGRFAAEFRVIRADGQQRWLAGKGQFAFEETADAGGGPGKRLPLRFMGVNHDITERKQAEEALARTTALLETLLATAPLGFCYFDRALRWIRINDRLAAMNGISAADHLGKTVAEVVPALLPAAQEITERILATGEAMVGHEFSGETPAQPGVTCHWSESWYPVRDASGTITGFGVIVQEITERKRAEAKLQEQERQLRLALTAGSLVPWSIDLDHGVVESSPELLELFGLDRRAGLWAREQWRALIHEEDRQGIFDSVDAAKTGREHHLEYRVRHPDGTIHWHETHALPVADATGRFTRLVGYVRDVTDRKRDEEALRQLNATLEQRVSERTAEVRQKADQLRLLASELVRAEERERRRLAQILHDDLQQTLVAAKMRLATLEPGATSDEVRARVQEVQELVSESIRTSRSLTANLTPPVLYDGGLVAALRWLAAQMREKHGLTVEVQAREEDEPKDQEMRVFIFQAVREMLFNVVKHAGVSAAKASLFPRDGLVSVRVEDTGKGFDATAEYRPEAMSGFGIFSLRERVNLMGGRLEIKSAPGEGTCVTLEAPQPGAASAPKTKAVSSTPATTLRPAAARPDGAIRVLVIDDYKFVREGIASLLRGERGIEVVGQAADGLEAVELATRLRPDVALMDISMPRMDGIEATRVIVAQVPSVRVIGLSMHEAGEMEAKMRAAGAVSYLRKDGPVTELIEAIRRCPAAILPNGNATSSPTSAWPGGA